jgi:hypothetical protein
MRYLFLWLFGVAFEFVVVLHSFQGALLSAYLLQPLIGGCISGVAILVAMVAGLPLRLRPVLRIWHGTVVGVLMAVALAAAGWVGLMAVLFADHPEPVSTVLGGFCSLLAIDFGVIHWPDPSRLNRGDAATRWPPY